MKFLPDRPTTHGQLYGTLPPGTLLGETLFDVCRVAISHYSLKTLEKQPSKSDNDALSQYCTRIGKTFVAGWLVDSIIDAYLKILVEGKPHLHAFLCSEANYICRPQGPPRNRFAKPRIAANVDFLILPFNLGSHWSLLILDRKSQGFTYLDSSKYSSVPDPSVMKNISDGLSVFWLIDSNKDDVINQECSKQNDSISCGLFLLHFVEMFIQKLPFQTKCKPDEMRRHVFRQLIRHEGNQEV